MTSGAYLLILAMDEEKFISLEVEMSTDLRTFALRLKVVEILERYSKVQQQLHLMRQWKKLWVHPN